MNDFQLELYTMLKNMCNDFPNNMELGSKVRALVNSIEEKRKQALIELTRLGELQEGDPNQVTIFDVIKEESND